MLKVEVITPEQIITQLEAEEVVVPTTNGVLGIRSGHVPLVAPLKAGEIVVKQASKTDHFAIAGGFLEVLGEQVRILADSAEHAHDLQEAAIQEAIKRAKELKEDAKDMEAIAEATALLEHNLVRLKVAQRKHARGRSHQEDSAY